MRKKRRLNPFGIPDVKIFETAKIIGIENITFGKFDMIDDFVLIYAKGKIRLGDYVHLSSFTSIIGGGELIMEDFSGIAAGCRIVTGTDDYKGFGFGNPCVDAKFRNLQNGKIHIGRFSVIGSNSVILPNVTIGEGATVGAGSVVTKDLEPWGVYVGNKKIGERDKNGVLENYADFLSMPEQERVSAYFV